MPGYGAGGSAGVMSKAISWTTKSVKLGDLKEWDKNPVQISKRDAAELAKSLAKFDHVLPYVAAAPLNGHGLPLLDGHQRKMVELQLNKVSPSTLVDVRIPSRKLSDKERQELVVRLRKNTGEFDFDKLANFFEVNDLLDWGFTEKELQLGGFELEDESRDAEPQVDRATELLKKWKVKTGDLWQIGEHRLICGDCTDAAVVARVMDGERARMLFTDAPYNTGDTWSGLQEYRGHKQVENDNREDWQEWASGCFVLWLEHALDKDLAGYWWFGQRESPRELLEHAGMKIRGHIVWVKEHYNVGRADYHSQYEECQYFSCGERHYSGARNQSDVRTANRVEEERLHPTQKPVSLFQGLIEQHDIDLVFEPFSGSGTTLVACQNLSRRCRAIEISPAYVAVALERMHDAFGITGVKVK